MALNPELQEVKREILAAIAASKDELREEIAELGKKVQYLCDNLLSDHERRTLNRVAR